MMMCYVVRGAGTSWEFLQMKRAKGRYLGGTWQTVAGKIEAGETAWQAALRELREETGLEAEELYCLDRVNSFYVHGDDTLWHAAVFCAIVDARKPVRINEEHEEWRWIERKEAEGSFLWPSDREGVRQVCEEILDNGAAKGYMRVK
jgi:dATP pyrophosphohydrolase